MRIETRAVRAVMIVICCALAMCSTRVARATDRFYWDIDVRSPSGQYRLEAKSPDNADGARRPFQSNFTYTLKDADKLLWTRRQSEKPHEAPPVGAWVHDSGWSVVRTGWDELMVFSPKGERAGMVKILEEFSPEESRVRVMPSTAGPIWSGSSRWYFAELSGKTHFVVRAWWGRRVIVELASGSVIADEGEINEQVFELERADAVAVLRKAAAQGSPPVDAASGRTDYKAIMEVTAAVQFVGAERIAEATPYLMRLEDSDYSGRSSTWPVWIDQELPEGSVDPFSYAEYTLRKKVQTAMRRLGVPPAGLPVTQFYHHHPEYAKRTAVMVRADGARAERVEQVKEGQSPLEVLGVIGAPDAVASFERTMAWEYDMDAAVPYTLQVVWTTTNPPVVSEMHRVTPARWQEGEARDRD